MKLISPAGDVISSSLDQEEAQTAEALVSELSTPHNEEKEGINSHVRGPSKLLDFQRGVKSTL